MRKMLLTVTSVALMGVAALSGATSAFAQAQDSAAAIEPLVLAACDAGEAEFRAQLATYSEAMAELVASGALTNDDALVRFQALRDAARAEDCGPVVDEVFEELFPDTAALGTTTAPAAGGGALAGEATSVSPS